MTLDQACTDFSSFSIPDHENAMSLRYLALLTRWIPVAMENYEQWPDRPSCGHFFGGVLWYGQDTAMPAVVLAACASSPEFRPPGSDFTREYLRSVVRNAIRYLAFTHDVGPSDCVRPSVSRGRPEPAGTKWGERGKGFFRESQCGRVIAHLVLAAALIRDLLDQEDRRMLAAIAADYLGRFEALPPQSGVFYDTQTEENAWTSLGLTACALLLENHPKADAWMDHARKWMICTVVRPQDLVDPREVADGKSVGYFAGRTCTTLPDNTSENHGIVHPSYMRSSIVLIGAATILLRAFGREVPKHALSGQAEIYSTLKTWSDANGVPHAPQGMDWPYFDFSGHALTHAMANLNLHDPDGALLEERVLRTMEASSVAHGGRTVTREAATFCHGRQDPAIMRERLIVNLAYAYLAHRMLGLGEIPPSDDDFSVRTRGVHLYPHGGALVHVHEKGTTSFSWRNRTMVLPSPQPGLRLVGYSQESLLASIGVRGKAATATTRHLSVRHRAHLGALLFVEDLAEASVERRVMCATLPDGRCVSYERLVARQNIVVDSLRQGYLSILNDGFFAEYPDLKGQRSIHWAGGSHTAVGYVAGSADEDEIIALGGAVTDSAVDSQWVNIDDEYGVVFSGDGRASYTNRHFFPVWHAVENDLLLNEVECPRDAATGDTVCELACLITPEQIHQVTAAVKFKHTMVLPDVILMEPEGFTIIANFSGSPVSVWQDDGIWSATRDGDQTDVAPSAGKAVAALWPSEFCVLGPNLLSTIV